MATADVLSLAEIDPELEAILQKTPLMKPPTSPDIHAFRALLAQRKKALTASYSSGSPQAIIQEDITIQGRDGDQIPARLYKPKSAPAGGSPLVMVFHGGGFAMGGLEGEELNCFNFTEQCGCICVNVDYRLAPENPFPAGINDSWDATKWAASNASKLGANPSKGFIIAGPSAGGNISDVIGHLARDENLSPPVTGLLEMNPALLPAPVVPEKYKRELRSYEQNKDAPGLTPATILYFEELLKPDFSSPLYAPFNHPAGHAGLPPVFLQVSGMDPLRDEALVYERLLRTEAGVKTKLKIYKGLPHGFWTIWPDLKATKRFVEDTMEGLTWLLEQGGQ